MIFRLQVRRSALDLLRYLDLLGLELCIISALEEHNRLYSKLWYTLMSLAMRYQ